MIKLDKFNYDLLAEQSDLGMLIVRQNEIVYVNSACGRILGYPLQIIKEWNLFDFTRIVYPKDRKPLMEDLKIIPDMLNARN